MTLEEIPDVLTDYATTYGIKLVTAIVVFYIGLKFINLIGGVLVRWFGKTNFDLALKGFIQSLSGMMMKVILIITCAGIAGFPTTSLVAMLGAAGLAIGLALSGTLQNFAGGILLLILKPFKIGDFIEAEGHSGTVTSIQIFNTILNTPDNKRIILPNGPVANNAIVNFTAEDKRRVDFVFGIGYDEDIDKARGIILGLITADERIHKVPEPAILLSALSDHTVNLTVRVWTDTPLYWDVNFSFNEKVKAAFDAAGITFPQRNIFMPQVGK
jgi:small conductance mechanosensitive channel